MKSSEPLFDLIKSLYQTEKRYFKVYASKHTIGEKNNYVRLFDAIDSMKEYDEDKLLKTFEGETFIKYLPSEKKYLYDNIISSLHAYHSEDFSIDFKLRSMFNTIELLYDKNLFTQAFKMVGKAKKLAMENDRFAALIEMSNWERRLAVRIPQPWDQKAYVKTLRDALSSLDNQIDYIDILSSASSIVMPVRFARTEKEVKAIKAVLKNPLLVNEKNATSPESRYLMNEVLVSFLYRLGQMGKAYQHSKKNVDLINTYPHLLMNNSDRYVNTMASYAGLCSETGKIQDCLNAIHQLRNIDEESKKSQSNQQKRAILLSYYMEFHMYIRHGLFHRGAAVIDKNEDLFLFFQEKLNVYYNINVYYFIVYLYLGAKEYNKALKWLNLLLNKGDFAQVEDVHCFAKIMNLIVHYELENDDILPYVIKSTYRFLYSRARLFKTETVILDFMRKKFAKISRHDKKAMDAAFVDFRSALTKILTTDSEKRVLDFFDFISWLDSKIEKKSFEEVVQSKVKNRMKT